MKWKPNLSIIVILLLLLIGCERDDICIDPTTPQLVIRFYDNAAPEEFKSVNSLLVKVAGFENDSITFAGKDSIALPVRVNELETKYLLTINYLDTIGKRTDTLTLKYQTEDVFVGRACGYKSIFNEVGYSNTNSWIKSLEIVSTKIENEKNAHVKIYH